MTDIEVLELVRSAYRSIKDSGEFTFPEDDRGLAYPYELPGVAERLGVEGLTSVKAFLLRKDASFARELIALEDSSSAATMNPHKVLSDAPYYVPTQTISELNIVMQKSESPQLRSFVHVGPKGSGKTAAHNQWLHAINTTLEDKKIFYVRCDAAKLFDHWEKETTGRDDWTECPTVDEYLSLQMLYVLAKYAFHEDELQRSKLAQQISAALRLERVLFNHVENRDLDRPVAVAMPVIEYIEDHVVKAINRYEAGNPDLSYVVDNMFKNRKTKRREWIRWLDCSNAVAEWMRKNGYWTIRILDGVDNLHLNTDNGRKCYKAFLPQIIGFAFRKPGPSETRLTAMRRKTYNDVCMHDPTTTASTTSIMPYVIPHTPPKLADVMEYRAKWLDGHRPAGPTLALLIRAIKQVFSTSAIFGDNFRNIIVAISALAATIRFRQLQSNIWDIRGQAEIQWKRNLLLGFRLYLSTERSWSQLNREKGVQFFNPFWIPEELIGSHSGFLEIPFLARIRLLEYLDSASLSYRKTQNVEEFLRRMGYSAELIDRVIVDATAFGWVDTVFKDGQKPSLAYEITSTGKFVLSELLTDIDTLYACALDTLLPVRFYQVGAVRVHSNHLHARTGYRGAAICTVMSFLSLMDRVNHLDRKRVVNVPYYREIVGCRFLNRTAQKTLWKQLREMLDGCDDQDNRMLKDGVRALGNLWGMAMTA